MSKTVPRSQAHPTVSVLTITQCKRFNCLKILHQMIQKQTYTNIKEWVLVEGSQTKSEAESNKKKINEFISGLNTTYKINYIEYSGKKLGGLRNLGNSACTSDIIVCLDDDDYYPPERIEHSVERLTNSKCLIGGVSDVYLYDFFMDKLYKFKGFLEYHSTNNCMAYKKEYLLTHSHDPEIEVGEERSFTLEFTTPLVKLDSRKTIIAISHNFNTFNKRELCLGGTLKTLNTLVEIEEPITNYIDEDIYKQMKEIYYVEEQSKYDIVYMCGGFNNKFDPKSITLDDTIRSLVKHSEYWVQKKKTVAVYGEFENDITVKGVEYISWKKFPYHFKFNILILFKMNGFLSSVPFPLKARKIFWDVYENFIHNDKVIEFWKKYGSKVDKIYFKSHFHKNEFKNHMGEEPKNYEILPTGLRLETFSTNYDNVKRNPYRFCYTTFYDRGLEFLITGVFSVIKKIEPRAELHIYSGMDMINDENYKNKMLTLFSSHGVCDHGAQSAEVIAREKYMSTFELYISNIINEVDCTSIRESAITGCIPLIANFGVFNERDGIRFDMNHEDPKIMQRNALLILNMMKDQNKITSISKDIKNNCPTFISYQQVAEVMSQSFN
uniref:Glycosyltransferase 2-like domain-containing protein n=1 Tax=viral metagenome TaxID=1070528 RepID=A0A6C0DCN0_9ZZZZ